MSTLRVVLIAVMTFALAASPLFVPSVSTSLFGSAAYAESGAGTSDLTVLQTGNDNDGVDNDGIGGPDDNDNDDGDNDNGGGNDNGDNDNGDDNDNDGGDNDNDDNDNDAPPAGPGGERPAPSAQAGCSTPGQEQVFVSNDGRIAVRVFSNMPRSLRFSIRMPVDPASVPAVPGRTVNGLLFELLIEDCNGTALGETPVEINLGIRYSDADAAGLNEQNFKISLRDPADDQWKQVEKQAADPDDNYTSATITQSGFYVLHQP